MKLGYGELALKEETDGMAEINLWALIVVKLSEYCILSGGVCYYSYLLKYILIPPVMLLVFMVWSD